jgi:hypothetical protein
MADPDPNPTVVPLNPALAEARTEGGGTGDDQARASRGQGRMTEDPFSNPDRSVEPQPPSPQKSASEPPGAALRIKDIQVNKSDARGLLITHVYAVQSDEYAVYKSGQVMVQFADDPEKAQIQRKSILSLSPARGELNSLLQGFKSHEECDHQLAYALQLALDGDVEGAKATIAATKTFVLAKRAAKGRFQYLKWSYGAAAVLIGLLFLASRAYPFPDTSSDLWLAGKAGLIGAVFSIALAIRGRTVALDTELLDNVTDGVLRLSIGVIAAGVLLLLLACGILPSLTLGEAKFTGSGLTWKTVLVIGFVAGFLERLVPDLLEKKNSQANGSNTTLSAAPAVR